MDFAIKSRSMATFTAKKAVCIGIVNYKRDLVQYYMSGIASDSLSQKTSFSAKFIFDGLSLDDIQIMPC